MKSKKIVMIPGPTPVVRSIQDQMGIETISFKDEDFVNDFKEVVLDLKKMWDTDGEAFIVAGSGTLAMEMAIANITKSGDEVLIISHGYFGDRFIELCERKKLNIDLLQSEWGKIVELEKIEKKLTENSYKAVIVTHVDTSTGVCAPIEEIGSLLNEYEDTLFVVDGVCATAAEPEYLNKMNIDVLLTASQKAFGVPTGLAIVLASSKAMQRREELKSIPEYYADFMKWLPIMHNPSKYFGTPSVRLVLAFKQSINIIKEEGLEERYRRHRRDARAIQYALEKLGFEILAEPTYRAVTLSNVIYPKGIKDEKFRKVLADEGIIVAGGLGEYAGKLFRLGHMGNIDDHTISSTLSAIERTLLKFNNKVEPGTAMNAFFNKRGSIK